MKLFVMAGTPAERQEFSNAVAGACDADVYNMAVVRDCLQSGMMDSIPWVIQSSLDEIRPKDVRLLRSSANVLVSLCVTVDNYQNDGYLYYADRANEAALFRRFAKPLFTPVGKYHTYALRGEADRQRFMDVNLPLERQFVE